MSNDTFFLIPFLFDSYPRVLLLVVFDFCLGVGTGKILGRIHMAQIKIGEHHFPCSFTILEVRKTGLKMQISVAVVVVEPGRCCCRCCCCCC